ncbi:MAG: hypothetical protein E7484_03175 [Ruminococcaceae bacterium]|nr:hypothetical protein [Oscillospiraceae bacterium]
MKKLIILLFSLIFIFSGCSTNEQPVYDLAVCNTEMTEFAEYLKGFESENYKLEKIEFSQEKLTEFTAALKENTDGLNSITFYGEGIDEELAASLIKFAKQINIPVTFAFSDISTETLTVYDKAFCITTNYTHAAEITAVKLKQLWSEGIIADSNEDQIFSFSIIKEESETDNLESYCNTLIAGIELYGIPMQINSTVSPADIADAQNLADLKVENEGIIVISPDVLPVVSQYATESENVEIITIQQGIENSFADSAYDVNCFINYKDYKLAADEIIANFNNRQYPLIESSFHVKDRTVFIPATI